MMLELIDWEIIGGFIAIFTLLLNLRSEIKDTYKRIDENRLERERHDEELMSRLTEIRREMDLCRLHHSRECTHDEE